MTDKSHQESTINKPPFFKSWKGMYWLVVGSLAVQVIVFYFLTQYYK